MRRQQLIVLCVGLVHAVGCGDAGIDEADDLKSELLVAATSSGCPSAGSPIRMATVTASELPEVSGLVASATNPGLFYAHNDSGGSAEVYAIDAAGALVARIRLSGATARDWEDAASGPGPDPAMRYLYVGDIGDNAARRSDIRIYRAVEPALDASARGVSMAVAAETITLRYPDGPHNAETLLVDPVTGDLAIVTKNEGGNSGVYVLQAPLIPGTVATLSLATTLQFGSAALPGSRLATGGDVAPDGRGILIRTYSGAFLWPRSAGQTLGSAFGNVACPVPAQREPQGEAIAFAIDGTAYYTLSEGTNQGLYGSAIAW